MQTFMEIISFIILFFKDFFNIKKIQ
jgi:hypothetical protein